MNVGDTWQRNAREGKWPLTSTLFGLHRGHKRTDWLLQQFGQTLKSHVMIWDVHTWGGLDSRWDQVSRTSLNPKGVIENHNAGFKIRVPLYPAREPLWEFRWPSSGMSSHCVDEKKNTSWCSPASCPGFFCRVHPVKAYIQHWVLFK